MGLAAASPNPIPALLPYSSYWTKSRQYAQAAFQPRRCTKWQYPREKYPAREEIRDAAPTGNWRSRALSLAPSVASPACLTEPARLAAITMAVKSFLLKLSKFARYENEREVVRSLPLFLFCCLCEDKLGVSRENAHVAACILHVLRRGRCPHRPKGTNEFAEDFRKNDLYRRVDVGIDPYGAAASV